MTRKEQSNFRTGLMFVSPWLIGFFAFCAYPVIVSIYYSMCDYSVLSPAVYNGWTNYHDLLSDAVFWKALYNTVYFAGFSIPLNLLVSLSLAILLNFNVPARGVLRTAIFLPSLVPMVCLAVLWQWMLNGRMGLINNSLKPVLELCNAFLGSHLNTPDWLEDARYARWGIIFTGLWGVGNAVIIYLAGLQNVPRYLYESAEIDGAGFWSKTWNVTLPILSPVIYFNVIISLIGSVQIFAIPYVMTNGGDGPDKSLLFIATYLYQNAFDYSKMGYACAIGVLLFLIIVVLTYAATKLSRRHIYYAGK